MTLNRTVSINLRSATSALRDIATLTPHMGVEKTQEMLRVLADRFEQMADEQDAERAIIEREIEGSCATCGAGPGGRCQLEGSGECPDGCVTQRDGNGYFRNRRFTWSFRSFRTPPHAGGFDRSL